MINDDSSDAADGDHAISPSSSTPSSSSSSGFQMMPPPPPTPSSHRRKKTSISDGDNIPIPLDPTSSSTVVIVVAAAMPPPVAMGGGGGGEDDVGGATPGVALETPATANGTKYFSGIIDFLIFEFYFFNIFAI
jgi:hypothetical protein